MQLKDTTKPNKKINKSDQTNLMCEKGKVHYYKGTFNLNYQNNKHKCYKIQNLSVKGTLWSLAPSDTKPI